MSGLTVAFQVLACIGFGMPMLRLFGIAATLTRAEQVCWAFALGMGTLGWLAFFVGIGGRLSPGPLAAVLAAGTMGLVAFRGAPARSPRRDGGFGRAEALLIAILGVVMLANLLQGLSPPADADSMAYHFDLPKRFLGAGRVFFVPRAMDGAVPLLIHMTYTTALGLGGEQALTLWTIASTWMCGGLFFTFACRFLDRRWALALTLVLLTTPAMLYGGGSGQVEVRNALFVLVAAASAAEALGSGRRRHAALAGVATGFFMAGKLLGLEFALACGLVLLAQRRWLAHGLAFTIAALAAGSQWYLWNWINSGDPFFPMLYGLVPYLDASGWTVERQREFNAFIASDERAVPINLTWLLAYPFVATLAGKPVFESGRSGLGPFVLLVLPFALAGLWRFRRRLGATALLPAAAITALFYVEWFVLGSSQRVRSVVPVYPLLLACVAVAAHRWAAARASLRPLAGAMAVTLLVQLGGLAVLTVNYARHVLTGESRDAFLWRNTTGYTAVQWINRHLTQADRIYLVLRPLNYLIDVPIFYAHFVQEARVDVGPHASDPVRFDRQLRAVGVTHLLVTEPGEGVAPAGLHLWQRLRDRGCLELIETFQIRTTASRTLTPDAGGGTATSHVYRLGEPSCLDR
ncbi:MAG: hypothetical protein HYU60_05310 [Magnetospirillum sp.]|nr:hypothetical protein [Magnetospirillum sp.]